MPACIRCAQFEIEFDRALRTIATLTAERDALTLTLATNCDDWATDDTAIRDALRPILGAVVDGDANGVPPLVDLVKQVVSKWRELEATCSPKTK